MDNKTKLLVHMAIAISLSTVLNLIPLWQMPQGGTVSLEMLPILFIALRWGMAPGILTGLTYGLLQLLFGPHIVHPAQLILDYPGAYLFLGLTGLFKNKIRNCKKNENLCLGAGSSLHRCSGALLFPSPFRRNLFWTLHPRGTKCLVIFYNL